MKKMTKKLVAFVGAALLATSSFAQVRGAFDRATADTIYNDNTYLMNVNRWNDLDFTNLYAFIDIGNNYDSTLNANVATRLGSNTLMIGYEGDLWTRTNSYNDLNVLYGFNNMAIEAGFTWSDNTYLGTYGSDFKVLSVAYGINPSEALNIYAGGAYVIVNGLGDNVSLSDVFINAGFVYFFANDPSNIAAFGLSYFGNYLNYTVGGFETSNSTNTITPAFKYQTQLGSGLTYGLVAATPIDLGDDIAIGFSIKNGISAQITDLLNLNFGLTTDLPTIVLGEDSIGRVDNSVSLGFTLNVSPEFKIDASTDFSPTNVSLDTIWTQPFNFSVSAKF